MFPYSHRSRLKRVPPWHSWISVSSNIKTFNHKEHDIVLGPNPRIESRKVQIVKSAISTLSFSELEAIIHIFDELEGDEGILVASRIADSVGITRSVIVNALRKFESAGVIESRSSGMKGTYIKVVNDVVFDELARLKQKK